MLLYKIARNEEGYKEKEWGDKEEIVEVDEEEVEDLEEENEKAKEKEKTEEEKRMQRGAGRGQIWCWLLPLLLILLLLLAILTLMHYWLIHLGLLILGPQGPQGFHLLPLISLVGL